MHRSQAVILTLLVLLTPAITRAAVTAAQVDTAINKAKEFLYKSQNADGHWETTPPPKPADLTSPDKRDDNQWGGRTAMAVYALLVCGERPTEPKLQKAITLLHTANVTGVYAVGLKCQVWLNLPPTPEVKKSMRRDALILLTSKKVLNQNYLVWDYCPVTPPRKAYSFSRSQYAALGLWAAEEMDVEIPADIWRGIEKTWTDAQGPEGGWRYTMEKGSGDINTTTMCMTAAGLATLFIAQDFTMAERFAAAKGNATSPPMEKAIKWITAHFKERFAVNAGGPNMTREFPLPMIYAIERVGLAGGLRRFGEHDWYDIGAEWLLKKQGANGAISGDFGPLPATCWAMLFLQRGRTPAAFNKLDYATGVADPKKAMWNQRPRDIANLTRWLSKSSEREMRWQIVGIDDTVNALIEAPVLYLSGDEPLDLKPEAKAKLKSYCESGGLILVNADGGNSGFARSVEKLGVELFPGAEWRELPDAHPIWANQNYKRDTFKTKVSMRGISNGVRELMVIIPTMDAAKAWQLRSAKRNEDAWKLGANVLSYAVGINQFYVRGESWLAPEPPATAKTTKAVTVGRLQYAGKWDPEPLAWAQMTKIAKAKGIELKTTTVKAGEAVSGVDLLHVTGAGAMKLDDSARKAIKEFADKGGTVLFEAAGGNGEFATSAYAEIVTMFGGDKLKTLPAAHALYAGTPAMPAVSYRTFNMEAIANPTAPQISGIEEGGKITVLLSKEDLTVGLLGVPTDGILGYKPSSAREVVMRILTNLKK